MYIFVEAEYNSHNNHNLGQSYYSPAEISQVDYFLHKLSLNFYGMPLYSIEIQMSVFFYYWQN